MVLTQEHFVILCLKSQVFLDLRTSIKIWSPVSCIDGTWMIFLIYFMIILHQFLLYIIILQDKVMVSSFQHSQIAQFHFLLRSMATFP